jgi:hypothetical protein
VERRQLLLTGSFNRTAYFVADQAADEFANIDSVRWSNSNSNVACSTVQSDEWGDGGSNRVSKSLNFKSYATKNWLSKLKYRLHLAFDYSNGKSQITVCIFSSELC